MPQTVMFDQLIMRGVRLALSAGGVVVAQVGYTVTDVTGEFSQDKSFFAALTPAQQTQLTNIFTAATNAAKAREGIP